MTTAEGILAVVMFLLAAALAVLSIRSFRNRGFLFNNAWIHASREERAAMDKKPWYRQSAIVFLLLSLLFAVLGLYAVLQDDRIRLLEIPLLLGTVVYAAVSTARIHRGSGRAAAADADRPHQPS